jgi:hypothetical protein
MLNQLGDLVAGVLDPLLHVGGDGSHGSSGFQIPDVTSMAALVP